MWLEGPRSHGKTTNANSCASAFCWSTPLWRAEGKFGPTRARSKSDGIQVISALAPMYPRTVSPDFASPDLVGGSVQRAAPSVNQTVSTAEPFLGWSARCNRLNLLQAGGQRGNSHFPKGFNDCRKSHCNFHLKCTFMHILHNRFQHPPNYSG